MSPLPREIVRWLQTLDLPVTIRLPKRDLSNGYLFAEMCARYWNGVELHSFENKLSKTNKEANWKVLKRYFVKNNFAVDEALIAGVINCDEGAAEQFLFTLYTALTKREIQLFAPTHEAEVDNVPMFVRSHHVQAAQQHSVDRNRNAQQDQHDEQKLVEERARVEAQRRAEAQQRQQQQHKPKTLSKAQAIQSSDATNQEGQVQHAVQFSAVTVKPLPPHLLARFGNNRSSASGAGGNAADKAGGARGGAGGSDDGSDVTAKISSIISKTLDDGGVPLWQTSSTVPTLAAFFFANNATIDVSVRNVVWSQLLSASGDIATALIKYSSTFQDFVDLLATHLASPPPPAVATTPSTGGALHPSIVVTKFFTTIVSAVAATNPAVALSALRDVLLPFVAQRCPLTAQSAQWYGELILAFVHVVGGVAPVFASSFFSTVYDGLVVATHGGSTSSGTRRDFLLILHVLLGGFAARRRFGVDDVPPPGAVTRVLDGQCAALAYYNAVAGLHSEAPNDRVVAMRVLARLVHLGAAGMVVDHQHIREFTRALTATPRPSWTRSTEGLIAYAQLVQAVLETPIEGDANRQAEARSSVIDAIPVMRYIALSNNSYSISSAARQVFLSVVSKSLALSTVKPTTDATALAEFFVNSPFVHTHAATLLERNAPSSLESLGGASASEEDVASTSWTQPASKIILQSSLLGAIAIPTLIRSSCPLRLALGILETTTPPPPAETSTADATSAPAPSTSSTNKPQQRGSTGTSASTSTAKVATRILKQGDVKELNVVRLRWLQALFAAHEDGTLAARTGGDVADEDLVSFWWEVVKQLESNIATVLYAAELLASLQQQHAAGKGGAAPLPADHVVAAVYEAAGYAQAILVRCFIDFSGHLSPAPKSFAEYHELRQDATIASRSMEWFQQVVVGS